MLRSEATSQSSTGGLTLYLVHTRRRREMTVGSAKATRLVRVASTLLFDLFSHFPCSATTQTGNVQGLCGRMSDLVFCVVQCRMQRSLNALVLKFGIR